MMRAECDIILDAVQACFSKRLSPEARESVWERVRHVECKHVAPIIRRLRDLDKLPANLGKAICDLGAALEPGGGGESVRWASPCAECDPGPGQGRIAWYAPRPDGRLMRHYAACARCRPGADRPSTRAELLAQGLRLAPCQAEVTAFSLQVLRHNEPDLARRVEGGGFRQLLAQGPHLSVRSQSVRSMSGGAVRGPATGVSHGAALESGGVFEDEDCEDGEGESGFESSP